MPKLRKTPQQRQELALWGAIAKGQKATGLSDKDLADIMDVTPNTFSRWRRAMFQKASFEAVCWIAQTLGVTGREWCEAAGIPYEEATQ